jgi:hypothetical protein
MKRNINHFLPPEKDIKSAVEAVLFENASPHIEATIPAYKEKMLL